MQIQVHIKLQYGLKDNKVVQSLRTRTLNQSENHTKTSGLGYNGVDAKGVPTTTTGFAAPSEINGKYMQKTKQWQKPVSFAVKEMLQ